MRDHGDYRDGGRGQEQAGGRSTRGPWREHRFLRATGRGQRLWVYPGRAFGNTVPAGDADGYLDTVPTPDAEAESRKKAFYESLYASSVC